MAVAWIWRQYWQTQTPRDYLFLGAVSGLVFGAAEAVHYFTNVLGSLSGNVNGLDLQDLTIQYIWRFLTDPIDHAMWAGITGYFIGLAITGPNRKYSIGLVGIAIAAVLHGLNDWNPINSHVAWVLVTLISVMLFLGYARAGAWLPQQALASAPALAPSAPGVPAGAARFPWAAVRPRAAAPARLRCPGGSRCPAATRPGGLRCPGWLRFPGGAGAGLTGRSARPREPWWQRSPAASARPVPRPASPRLARAAGCRAARRRSAQRRHSAHRGTAQVGPQAMVGAVAPGP